ncbi:MAG: gliding motility-associated C-terminal domain-containing protein, partial [Bacteroidota bacterium]
MDPTFTNAKITTQIQDIEIGAIWSLLIFPRSIPNIILRHVLDGKNQFSPNGDGTNDFLVIQDVASFTNASLEIFNRYGHQVF